MELALGQYFHLGPVTTWNLACPLGKGWYSVSSARKHKTLFERWSVTDVKITLWAYWGTTSCLFRVFLFEFIMESNEIITYPGSSIYIR